MFQERYPKRYSPAIMSKTAIPRIKWALLSCRDGTKIAREVCNPTKMENRRIAGDVYFAQR